MNKKYSMIWLSILAISSLSLSGWAFNDTQSYWAQSAIERLNSQSIYGGYPDGSFRPNGDITRAEFATILAKAANLTPLTNGGATFMDVPSTHWAFGAIEATKGAGLVTGFPGGVFYPNKTITRTEALAMLSSAAGLKFPTDAEAAQILTTYSDGNDVPSWGRRAVAASLKAGLLNQFPNPQQINPNAVATRGEIAAMVDTYRSVAFKPQTPANMANMSPSSMPSTASNVMQGYVTSVSEGTTFTGTLNSAISTSLNRSGDPIALTLDAPLYGQGQGGQVTVVVPQGATINGILKRVEPAGRSGKNAVLEADFTEMRLPDGSRLPLVARIATENGVLEGGSTKGRLLKALGKTAIGAGAGAALGTAQGALSGGKPGKGAVYGTAIGGSLGAAAALWQKGQEVVLQSGEQLQIQLQRPLSLSNINTNN